MKRIAAIAATAIMAASAWAQYPYKLIMPIPGAEEGDVAYFTNFDTGERGDSAVVEHGAAIFQGELDEPYVIRVFCNGNRYGTFILEQGTTAFNQTTHRAVGSMLNDMYNEYYDSISAIDKHYEEAASDQERAKLKAQYVGLMRSVAEDNIDNALGYYVFIDYANSVEPSEMLAFIDEHPDLKQYRRVQGLIEAAKKKAVTSAGQPFVDFEVTYEGVARKLSDYVGQGQYTLVDFWASWCGPCVREIGVLKDIYKEWHPKGLQVLGVAVWDKPDDTLAAIERLGIPWECMLDTQTIATDAYGIPSIPCIIMFDPEGKIVFRDLQGSDLRKAVAKVMEK